MNASRPRTIAFYLPQFHPTPENSEWWGAGFTEWTNTAKATPLFRGHRQPRIPADLGFYDLRLAETRAAQSSLAKEYGVDAFCYWHYWFGNGKRILERPFEEVLASGAPDHGFCLGWANQTWTGIWHGADDRVLIEQTYPGIEDERAHFEHLLPAFTDPRYVTIDGRPLFYIFRPEQLPDAAGFVDRWRAMALEAGLPGIYLVAEVSDLLGRGPRYTRIGEDGFDAGVYVRLPAQTSRADVLRMRLQRKLLKSPERYRYAAQLPQPPSDVRSKVHPCVYPNWDNTPRAGRRGLVVEGNSPQAFEGHVREAVQMTQEWPETERMIFVKSWNEWAEGNHLEPDIHGGRANLEAFASGLAARHE
jgi:hypothetical protein